MVERRLADKVTVLTRGQRCGDAWRGQRRRICRCSRTFQWRNATYKDHDTDAERYDDYHRCRVMTRLTITRYRNGDMVRQRFLTKVKYNDGLAPDLFDPDRPSS